MWGKESGLENEHFEDVRNQMAVGLHLKISQNPQIVFSVEV